jgi:hypothetical protein
MKVHFNNNKKMLQNNTCYYIFGDFNAFSPKISYSKELGLMWPKLALKFNRIILFEIRHVFLKYAITPSEFVQCLHEDFGSILTIFNFWEEESSS